MANTAADCDAMLDAMLDASGRAKQALAIGDQLRYDPDHRGLIGLAREKKFGPLMKMSRLRGLKTACATA
jgi:predicted dehydrogenase